MYGLEFHKDDNALICGSAEFEVRKHGRHHYHKIAFGPQGMRLYYSPFYPEPDDWVVVKDQAEAEDIESILPTDFGLQWTFSQFMLALTFYREGHKRGYTQGEWKGRESERNRIKYEQSHTEA
jgi:hypothetical protein